MSETPVMRYLAAPSYLIPLQATQSNDYTIKVVQGTVRGDGNEDVFLLKTDGQGRI